MTTNQSRVEPLAGGDQTSPFAPACACLCQHGRQAAGVAAGRPGAKENGIPKDKASPLRLALFGKSNLLRAVYGYAFTAFQRR
jgi:hypothetical protein